jgi:Membrane bound FAD containing D-sorbitol dehydrogenase
MATACEAPRRLDNFVRLSAVLTGFTEQAIPKNLKALYLTTADAKLPPGTVDALLSRFQELAGKPAQQIADTLLDTDNAHPDLAAAARSILKLWYVGIWYPPTPPPTVVSADAYTGGLIWKAAQAHPIGFSTFQFGDWEREPPSLQDFGVDIAPLAGRR